MVEITGSSIAGYTFGLVALAAGAVGSLFGLLFLLSGTGGGVSLLLFGLVLLIAGVVATPISRRLLSKYLGVDFSRGAVVAISGGASVIAVVLFVVAIIGLLSGVTPAPPGADVSNVSVSSQDAVASSESSLSVTWNSRAQSAVDPDTEDLNIYNSPDGQKFVVVRMQIENTGSRDVELTPRLFKLRSGGTIYEYQRLFGSSDGLVGVTLQPGGTYDGWIAYSIPEDTESATLIVDQDAYFDRNVTVSFSKDSSLEINVAD